MPTQCAKCFSIKTKEEKDKKTGKVYIKCAECGYVFCARIEKPEEVA